jgi:hypothetical protein
MPRTSGTMTLPAGNPVVSGTVISTSWANGTMNDIANELTNSIPRDGTAPPTANIPMGNFKLTGIGAATLGTDVPQYQQLQTGGANYLTAVAGTNTITASLTSPALAAYAAGNTFRFVAAGANTGAVTLNINGLGAKTIQKNGQALITGDILSGTAHEVVYDGTNFQLIEGVQANSLQNQSYTSFTTGGTSTAYTLTPTPALTALAAGQRFNVTFNATAGATPTLAISGLTAKSLKYYDATGTKQSVTSTNVVANLNSDVIYDGTDYVVVNVLGGGSSISQGNSSVTVTDAGTGNVTTTLDGTVREVLTLAAKTSTIDGGSTLYPEFKCRAWVNWNGTGVVAIRGSGNVTSVTDNAVGDYTINLTTALPDANYSSTLGSGNNGAATTAFMQIHQTVAPTASALRVQALNVAGSLVDVVQNSVSIFR